MYTDLELINSENKDYTEETKVCYEKAYESAVAQLKEEMKQHPSNVFLHEFEEWHTTNMSKQFYFDSFVAEGTALMSRNQQLDADRVDESIKVFRDAIGNFFVLRKEKYNENNSTVDTLMPLKSVPLPTDKYKPKTYFPKSTDVIYYMYYTENYKKICKHYFVILNGVIIILDDPNANSGLRALGYLPIPRERDIAPSAVIISTLFPMQNLKFIYVIDKKRNTYSIDVTGPKISIKMYLSNFGFLRFSKEALEKGREEARSFKMRQVYEALSIDEAELPLSRVTFPVLVDEPPPEEKLAEEEEVSKEEKNKEGEESKISDKKEEIKTDEQSENEKSGESESKSDGCVANDVEEKEKEKEKVIKAEPSEEQKDEAK